MLDRRLEALLEPEMRRALVLEWLQTCPSDEAGAVAGAVLARTRSSDPLRRALCDVLTGSSSSRLDYTRRVDLYAEDRSSSSEWDLDVQKEECQQDTA